MFRCGDEKNPSWESSVVSGLPKPLRQQHGCECVSVSIKEEFPLDSSYEVCLAHSLSSPYSRGVPCGLERAILVPRHAVFHIAFN
jgi:hypothetical protein